MFSPPGQSVSKRLIGTAVLPLGLLLLASPSYAQEDGGGVYWHLDPNVETCSMVIDPSLTQGQWETFTRQISGIATFKSLESAGPLGKMNFTLGIDYSTTPVDQHDPAWINTFTHPDADCPLGDEINTPTLPARLGVSAKMDVGAYWTTAPGANYGLLGGEFKYAFLRESAKAPAAALIASFGMLTGAPDYNISVYSLGLMAGKRLAKFTPYLGIRESVAIATETTSKVDLDRETLPLTQGFIGSTFSLWKLGLAAEYNVAAVNTLSFLIGFNRRSQAH